MEIRTVFLILLAAVVALALVLFQYYHKGKGNVRVRIWLSFFRFLTFFGIFILLINPRFTKREYELEKPFLLLLADNSMSVAAFSDTLRGLYDALGNNAALAERFRVRAYNFDSSLLPGDSLDFKGHHTNIQKAISMASGVNSQTNTAIVLLTDGNQTQGEDYIFRAKGTNASVYPIVVGDTTRYEDVRIERVNVNTYAFLKNKFPLEILIGYEGNSVVESKCTIRINGRSVYSQGIRLGPLDNSLILNVPLTAESVGAKTIAVSVAPLDGERNIRNNTKSVGVEVIDEKTKVVLVSSILHPDIGALKKAIESNQQRTVSVVRPGDRSGEMNDADVFILYQPNASFAPVFEYINTNKSHYLTLTGTHTDWSFLNKVQNGFSKSALGQTEEIGPVPNPSFGVFDVSDFSVGNFPPLEGELGEILIDKPHEVLLEQRIKGVELGEPLMVVMGMDGQREAVIFGENIWKWRMQGYRDEADFRNFDALMGKLLLYLTRDRFKRRLDVDYDIVYENSGDNRILARYFDTAYEMDTDAELTIILTSDKTGQKSEVPMLLREDHFEADLGNYSPGKYNFTVGVDGTDIRFSGNFTIMDFNVEQQLQSSDYARLSQLATNTEGTLFFPRDIERLEEELLGEQRYLPIQKSVENVVSLIDYRLVLLLILTGLAAEWFIRKYNGLI
ncbi:MAG: VWA domain-containing protein, partial [Bacteroidota bacterium]